MNEEVFSGNRVTCHHLKNILCLNHSRYKNDVLLLVIALIHILQIIITAYFMAYLIIISIAFSSLENKIISTQFFKEYIGCQTEGIYLIALPATYESINGGAP